VSVLPAFKVHGVHKQIFDWIYQSARGVRNPTLQTTKHLRVNREIDRHVHGLQLKYYRKHST
jgi:hypothetical protein